MSTALFLEKSASACKNTTDLQGSGEDIQMVKDGDVVAIFNNIHRVMKAEKVLKEKRLEMLLIPAPRALKSDCGLAIRYEEADRQVIEETLRDAGLAPEEIYRKKGEEFVRIDNIGG